MADNIFNKHIKSDTLTDADLADLLSIDTTWQQLESPVQNQVLAEARMRVVKSKLKSQHLLDALAKRDPEKAVELINTLVNKLKQKKVSNKYTVDAIIRALNIESILEEIRKHPHVFKKFIIILQQSNAIRSPRIIALIENRPTIAINIIELLERDQQIFKSLLSLNFINKIIDSQLNKINETKRSSLNNLSFLNSRLKKGIYKISEKSTVKKEIIKSTSEIILFVLSNEETWNKLNDDQKSILENTAVQLIKSRKYNYISLLKYLTIIKPEMASHSVLYLLEHKPTKIKAKQLTEELSFIINYSQLWEIFSKSHKKLIYDAVSESLSNAETFDPLVLNAINRRNPDISRDWAVNFLASTRVHFFYPEYSLLALANILNDDSIWENLNQQEKQIAIDQGSEILIDPIMANTTPHINLFDYLFKGLALRYPENAAQVCLQIYNSIDVLFDTPESQTEVLKKLTENDSIKQYITETQILDIKLKALEISRTIE